MYTHTQLIDEKYFADMTIGGGAFPYGDLLKIKAGLREIRKT